MRILAVCLAILAFSRTAVAMDVQPGDHVITVSEGIACVDWSTFERFRDADPRTPKAKFPAGCVHVITPPPPIFIVDAVKEDAAAICVRGSISPPPCYWFSFDKVRTMLSVGQSKV
jgi:hypothetical protein